ncbi:MULTISPECIES: RHS repeat domain-containing protein [Niastella]|uniref:RHS repeat protein n=1 Tax=Niastella soli TaxID=2821487 RepID=A0ABS3Z5H0_9BACT|nr:RHS repeat domain-containing protein [Niastella soli]MBO9205410.1 RHS repeat protein [Niastella soli]
MRSFTWPIHLFVLLFPFVLSAQYQQNLPQPKPIPPNAAALFKVLERPLGTFTGTIPINFPLCNVNSGSLSADLSLNYTATGGLKVEELSSCVGLGFNLSDGGGRITQQVRGQPDDWSTGMFNGNPKPSAFNCGNNSHLYIAANGFLDLEPDIFFYSFNGHNGKFFFKETGELVKMTNDGIKIDTIMESNMGAPGGIGFRGFIITDEKGNKYYYGRKRDGTGNYKISNFSSYTSGGGSSSPSAPSSISYYLTEAYDMNGENCIRYSYTTGGNQFVTYAGSARPLSTAGLSCPLFSFSSNGGTVNTDGTEYLVSRIDANSGYLLFSYATDFTNGPKRLVNIEQYDSLGTYKGKYTFNYGTSFSSNRWKLVSFSQFGSSGTDSIAHKFEYHQLNNLPSVLSPSVDAWGFYNGQANIGSELIPNLLISNGWGDFIWDFYANRVASEPYSKANVLTKIIYPTGGYREIEYEGNKAAASGDFFTYHPDPNYMVSQNFSETGFVNGGTSVPCLKEPFTINSTYGLAKFGYTLNNVNFNCGTSYNVKIYQVTTEGQMTGGVLLYTFTGQPNGTCNLKNGYYRAEVNLTVTMPSCTMGGITGNWSEGTADNSTINTGFGTWKRRQYNIGGVRVRSLKDYDPSTGKTNQTDYYYKMYSIDSTMGSGFLVSPVKITSQENNPTTNCDYVKISPPGSAYPMASEGGSYVVYPEVRTVETGNGWTDRQFIFAADVPSNTFPVVPGSDASYYRGKLTQEKIYRNDGALLQKTVNTYLYSTPPLQVGKRFKLYWLYTFDWGENKPSGSCNDMNLDCIADLADCQSYSVYLPVTVPAQTIDSVFFPQQPGTSSIIKTNYSYEQYQGIYFLKQKKVTINNDQTKEQSFKYAFTAVSDFNLGLTGGEQINKDTLKARNYLQPIEITDSIKTNGTNPVFLAGAKYIFNNASGKIRLLQYRGYTSATDYNELNFSGYDNRGNLTEQYKTNAFREVYLWGYKGRFPVAKIIGETYAVATQGINLSVLDNPSSDAALKTELDKVRANLASSMAQVTTYSYSSVYGIMTSMTSPEGIITYYEYDAFGRLLNVKDTNGKIVKRYEYKLVNP